MTKQAMLPCLVCGKVLDNVFVEAINQPSEGTEFRTYGHYGSTFWDSFDGEQIVVNVCDECLRAHTDRIARHKVHRNIQVNHFIVGKEHLQREMVPYFDGPEDQDAVQVDVDEIDALAKRNNVELYTERVEFARQHEAELESQ